LLGRWGWRLRHAIAASRLGKLPNVLNVIAGHMSLVGPRAIRESDSAAMDQHWLRNLLLVRPGVTGPAADAARGEGLEQQTIKDIAYVRSYSIWLDVRLLFACLKRVLRRKKSLPSSYLSIHYPSTERETAAATEAARRVS
jgi:lipopolysaccharide/colanic/teichoic acid biosynthesis glycosyltransferase